MAVYTPDAMFPHNASTLIPQQQPFIMVDELLYADEVTAKSNFKITAENVFCIAGIFQEGGLLENMAQTAAAHSGFMALGSDGKVKKGFIGAVNNFEVIELPRQGDVLLTEIKITDQVFDVTVISGSVYCDDKVVAGAEMKIFIQE